ncbi:hypothetical protein ABPG72_018931 [Tetrahymena utriculariae]
MQKMISDLTFLDGPVDVTHDHYKKQDVMVLKLKEMYGYQNKIRESSQLYKKKRLANTNSMNQNYLKEELQKIEHNKKLKEVIEKQLQEEIDIELDILLDRDIKDRNAELMQKKIDFINSLEEYNKIIQYQMVKQLIEVKQIQEKFCIDFNQKISEIKDYVSTIEDYNKMHSKIDELNKKASKSLTNYRKKQLQNEKIKIDEIQRDYLLKITSNIDLILNSENALSSPVKQLLLFKLNEILFFLDELMKSKRNYQIFLIESFQTQSINLTNIELFSMNDNNDNEDDEDEELEEFLVIKQNNYNLANELQQNSTNKIIIDGIAIDYSEIKSNKNENEQKQGEKNQINITTAIEERIQKIQLRYQKNQLKKQKKKSLSQPPSFSNEIIELELQNLMRFYNKLKQVEKIIAHKQMMKYDEIQNILLILWQFQDIIAIQISCAKNKLEKYLINLNNKVFIPQEIIRLINRQVKLLKAIPDQEQAKSYIENQKRNNTFKRYANDQGKITNFHFVLNANNLKPLLQKIDPQSFLNDEKKQQKQMQSKLKKLKEDAVKKYVKSKLNQTATQFITNSELQSGRVSPTNSCKNSQDSGCNRDRSISQGSMYGSLQQNIIQEELKEKQKNELKIFYLNEHFDNVQPQRGKVTNLKSKTKSVSLSQTPLQKQSQKMNITKYVNDSFDNSGLNNLICEKQKEIDIRADVHYVMLSNIFSHNNELIEIEDFIEKERSKQEENQEEQQLNPKQLYNDRYSRFKLKSSSSTRPTTGKTIRAKNEIANSQISNQSPNFQSVSEDISSKFQRVKSNNLSVSFYVNDKNQTVNTSRPSSSYQKFGGGKKKRSNSGISSFINNQSSFTQNYSQLQQPRTSYQNIYQQQKNITPIREQFSKDIANDSKYQSIQQSQGQSLENTYIISQDSKLQQNQIDQEEQQPDNQMYLDEAEKKEAEKLKRRKNLMIEILERKRPRYIFLGSSRNPIKGTPEQIQEIERNAHFVQQREKQQVQQKERVKLKKRIQHLEKQWEVSNIETLAGPPKKYYVETSTIQHDFKDKLISKIINH